MLVLSRKVGQELVIGDNIRIVINRVAGNRVAIAIDAPEDVAILRSELKAIQDEFKDDECGLLRVATPAEEETGNVQAARARCAR